MRRSLQTAEGERDLFDSMQSRRVFESIARSNACSSEDSTKRASMASRPSVWRKRSYVPPYAEFEAALSPPDPICRTWRPHWIWMRNAETVPSAYFFKSGSVALRLPHSDMDCP